MHNVFSNISGIPSRVILYFKPLDDTIVSGEDSGRFVGSGVSLSSSDSDENEIYRPCKGESENETESMRGEVTLPELDIGDGDNDGEGDDDGGGDAGCTKTREITRRCEQLRNTHKGVVEWVFFCSDQCIGYERLL